MDPYILAPWRDVAVILLVIIAAVIVAVPGVVFFFIVKGLRALKRLLRPPLRRAQVWALRIQQGTVRATDVVASVPINVRSASARATVTARGVFDYLVGR